MSIYPQEDTDHNHNECMATKNELAALRAQVEALDAEATRNADLNMKQAKQIAELQRKLSTYEEAAKQEPVGKVSSKTVILEGSKNMYAVAYIDTSLKMGQELYALPPNTAALIERAVKEVEDAIRARKP